MPTERKIEAVADLKARLERATLMVSAQYRGLRVKEMQEMRRKLREGGLEVTVIKNTLLRLAAEQAGRTDVMKVVEGPTALAIAYGDPIDAAKGLAAYLPGSPAAFAVTGGVLESQVLSAEQLRELTRIPPRPVLLSQLLGQLQSPLAGFIGLLEAPLRELSALLQALLGELPGLIEARAKQLETSQ
jgi:large subunit ribosomal protein L10